VDFIGRATAAGQITARVTITSAETDVVPSDNMATAVTTVAAAAR
jgi:hypothetical protein